MPKRPNHILSDQERLFVDEYLIDLCQSHAARRAGYSAKSSGRMGSRLMKRPRVRAAIDEAMARRARRVEVDQDRVVQALAAVAFADPRKLFDETGALLPMDKLPDEAAALVAGMDIVAGTRDGGSESGGKAGHGGAYLAKIRIADRLKALELLGKHLGMFSDNPASADNDGEVPSIEVTFVGKDGKVLEMPGERRD